MYCVLFHFMLTQCRLAVSQDDVRLIARTMERSEMKITEDEGPTNEEMREQVAESIRRMKGGWKI